MRPSNKYWIDGVLGIVTLPPHTTTPVDGTVTSNYMHAQLDSVYPHGFNLSYAQAALRSGGRRCGHGLAMLTQPLLVRGA
jgi:hypothetical protein